MSIINEVKNLINENLNVPPGSDTTVKLPTPEVSKFLKKVGNYEDIVYSTKLDGVRCLSVVDESFNVKYISRNNKEFLNFSKFDEDVVEIAKCLSKKGYSFPIEIDGEVISKSQSFTKLMTQVRRLNNADPSIFKYAIFDVVSRDPFQKRFGDLKSCYDKSTTSSDFYLLPHYAGQIEKEQDLYTIAQNLIDKGEEGAVFKLLNDNGYERKKSSFWSKIKNIETIDLRIVDFQEGTGKYKGMLGAFILDNNGTKVKVGTGFTDEQREEFWKRRNELKGTFVEVQYSEGTEDDSLRFPVFVRLREEK